MLVTSASASLHGYYTGGGPYTGRRANSSACAVQLLKQHSRTACEEGTNYGCAAADSIWANGCRGTFRCAGGPKFDCGYPPGKPQYSCRCDGADDWLANLIAEPRAREGPSDRVAVCIFGMMRDHFAHGGRSVHAKMRASILNATVLGAGAVDVFVDMWADYGADRNKRVIHNVEASERIHVDWQAEFGDQLVSLTVEQTPPGVSVRLHGLRLPTRYISQAPNYFSGTLPMLWKMRGCAAAIDRWERASGFEYAAVISARPDAYFWSDRLAQRLVKTTRAILRRSAARAHPAGAMSASLFFVNVGRLDLQRQAGDKYAVGTSAAMRFYLDAWSKAAALWSASTSGAALLAERLMYNHLATAPFNVSAIGLDPGEDFGPDALPGDARWRRGESISLEPFGACKATLVARHSRKACLPGTSFGCTDRRSIWTRNCRGEFRCGAEGPSFSCGYPAGKDSYSCKCSHREHAKAASPAFNHGDALLTHAGVRGGLASVITRGLASAIPDIVQPPGASDLHTGKQTWAVAVVGQARTLATDAVSDKLRSNVVAPLRESHGADWFFTVDSGGLDVSPLRWRAALEGLNVLGLRDIRSEGALRPTDAKLQLCLGMMEGVERAVGSKYTWMLTMRPDLEHLQPINVAAMAAVPERGMLHLYDMIAVCRRSAVSDAKPCSAPNYASTEGAQGRLWHVRLRRNDPLQNAVEWWLMSPLNWFRALSSLAKRPGIPPVRAAGCALRAVAYGCAALSRYHDDAARSLPLKREWEMGADSAFGSGDATGSPTFELWKIAKGKDGGSSSVQDLIRSLTHKMEQSVDRVRHTNLQNLRNPSDALPADAMCAGMRTYCGGLAGESDGDAGSFARDICRMSWDRPQKALLYHNPAMEPHFSPEVKECLSLAS